MRAGILVAAALAVALTAAPAQAAPHFGIGQGLNPGVAIDGAGTAYVGWQVNTLADTGDAVQLCVLPAKARACAAQPTIAFPGTGYTATVRLVPRHGHTRRLRLPVRACGRIS